MLKEETKVFLRRLGIGHSRWHAMEPDDMAEIIYENLNRPLIVRGFYESLSERERKAVDRYLSHWRNLEENHQMGEGLRWGSNHRYAPAYSEMNEIFLRSQEVETRKSLNLDSN